jgi:hypothetical protein
VQDQRDTTDVLGALSERQERSDHQRRSQPVLVEERVREGRESKDQQGREHPADDLERDRALEQPPQPSPLLARGIPEPVFHQRFLDREVEQALEESRRGHDQRVETEGLRREDVERDDRAEKAECS